MASVSGGVSQTFLGKDAEFDFDGPEIIFSKLLESLETNQTHIGINPHMGSHERGAVEQALLQSVAGAAVDVLNRERRFDVDDPLHVVAHANRRRCAAVENT